MEQSPAYPTSTAPFRRFEFAQRCMRNGETVMDISFGPSSDDRGPCNIAIPKGDAIQLLRCLERQIDWK